MEIRKAIVAGTFYPSHTASLKSLLTNLFENEVDVKIKNVHGLVVPHAGYIYSGKTAAKAYSLLKNILKEDDDVCFIILGTDHTGYASDFSLSTRHFETPLGIIINNLSLGKKFKKVVSNEKRDELAHNYEHSIEAQLPFLQFISSEIGFKFSIVPIICSTLDIKKIKEFCKVVYNVIRKEKKKIIFIASSDMTHYGLAYNFDPFYNLSIKEKIKKVYEIDKSIISKILNFDVANFIKEARNTTICGISPIATITEIMKRIKCKGKLIDYSSSGEISGDWNNFVGYASIIFY